MAAPKRKPRSTTPSCQAPCSVLRRQSYSPINVRRLCFERNADGLSQDIADGMSQGNAQGMSQGMSQGNAQGKSQGNAQGTGLGR